MIKREFDIVMLTRQFRTYSQAKPPLHPPTVSMIMLFTTSPQASKNCPDNKISNNSIFFSLTQMIQTSQGCQGIQVLANRHHLTLSRSRSPTQNSWFLTSFSLKCTNLQMYQHTRNVNEDNSNGQCTMNKILGIWKIG